MDADEDEDGDGGRKCGGRRWLAGEERKKGRIAKLERMNGWRVAGTQYVHVG